MNPTIAWSEPFYGVSHMKTPKGARYQLTVEDYGSYAIASLFPLRDRPIFNCEEKMFNQGTGRSAEAAKRWLEAEAIKRNVFSLPAPAGISRHPVAMPVDSPVTRDGDKQPSLF